MAKKKLRCPNCGRYRAEIKGFFDQKLECDYCNAVSRPISEEKIEVRTGWFSSSTYTQTTYGVAGGQEWKENWSKVRKEALERAGNRCQRCFSSKNLQVHHKKPVSKGGKDNISNLIVLCTKCHRKEHKKKGWFF